MDLRDRRLDRELTQAEVALLAGVTQPTISKLERGKLRCPRPRNLGRLAKAYGTTVAEIRGACDGRGEAR